MDNENKSLRIAENRKRVFDQMASMHFKLSDEYNFKAKAEYAIEIIVSILLCGITFLDQEKYFSISANTTTLIIGFIAIFLLAFTLIKQNMSHKQLCEKHHNAGKIYAQAKLEIADMIAEWLVNETDDKSILDYLQEHFRSLNDLPQIPEKCFNRLKHAHQYKVAMSRFLDDHQGEPWIICKFKFWFSRKRMSCPSFSKHKPEKNEYTAPK